VFWFYFFSDRIIVM